MSVRRRAVLAAADHESLGTVVWAGDDEVILLVSGPYHVLTLTGQTVLLDEFGQPTRVLRVGDFVRERCTPAPGGGFAALRIEIVRPAWRWPGPDET